MAISFTNAVNLSKEITKKVVSSPYEWTNYLKVTSNIYKYSFRDKLMIYAQRPDATACASMETWNKKLGHWVKAGSKGIALFRNNNGKLKLEYVFDISDTYAVRQAKPPNLWKLSKEHHQAVIEEFEKHYGIISGENFIDKLMKYAENFVEKNYDDYFHDLSISTKNSFLENIKKEDIEKTFKNILISSVQYTLLSRCGIDADNFFNEEDFKGIDLFNNAETFSYIGMAVSDLSRTLLHQTERAVKAFDKKKNQEKQTQSIEKSEKIEYTNNKEFNTLKYKSIEEQEEKKYDGQEQTAENINYGGNGNNISTSRGLSNTTDRAGGTEGNRNLWTKTNEVSERESKTLLQFSDSFGRTQQIFSGDRPTGEHSNGEINGTNDEKERNNGTVESTKSNEVGAGSEQHQSKSRRNNTERNNLQLVIFPSVEEQIETITQAEEKKSSAFFVPQKEIDTILCFKNDNDKKFLIYSYFLNKRLAVSQARFLQDTYGYIKYNYILENNSKCTINFNRRGLTIISENEKNSFMRLTWGQIAGRIKEMVLNDKYLSEDELEQYFSWNENRKKELEKELMQGEILIKSPFSNEETIIKFDDSKNQQEVITRNIQETNKQPKEEAAEQKEKEKQNNNFSIHAKEYAILKTDYPDYITILEKNNQCMLCGKDVEEVENILSDKSHIENVTNLGKIPIISFPSDKLEDYTNQFKEKGLNFIVAKENENPKYYKITQVSDIDNKIFIGKQFTIKDITFQIQEIDYNKKEVTFQSMETYGLPIIHQQSIDYTLSIIEKQENENQIKPLILTQNRKDELKEIANVEKFNTIFLEINKYLGDNIDTDSLKTILSKNYIDIYDKIIFSNGQKASIETTKYGIGVYTSFSAKTINWEQIIAFVKETYKNNSIKQENNLTEIAEKIPKEKKSFIYDGVNYKILIGRKFKYNNDLYAVKSINPGRIMTLKNMDNDSEEHHYIDVVLPFIAKNDKIAQSILNIETKERLKIIINSEKFNDVIAGANEYLENNPDNKGLTDFISINYIGISDNIEYLGEFTTNGNGIAINIGENIVTIEWQQVAAYIYQMYLDNSNKKEIYIVNEDIRDIRDEISENSNIDNNDVSNFQIKDDNLGIGGQKAKYKFNVEAIKTLKLIEKENRLATEEEKEILSKYVGWGGISQAFDADNSKWTKEYQELKELLTDDEYISARRTTLSSFYTSPTIIKAIYEAIQQSGLETEKILEPSCGIGNFFGLLPKEMEQSKLYGIELDSITGGIAKQLYPNANIKISDYQGINYPDNFFDTAIGNIPFGNYKVFDSNYQKLNFYIHDYFFAKTIDKVKPNGMIAFITSKGFLDKQDINARKYIAQRANLIGAIRLPNNAFKENAGTNVTSDIVFLQKRETLLESEIEPDWVNIGKTAQGIPLNQYFLKHHEMILGKMEFSQNMYGGENDTACIPFENADLSEQLKLAVEHLEFTKLQPLEIDNAIEDTDDIDNTEEQIEGCIEVPEDTNIKNFSYTMIDEKLYFREGQFFIPVNNIKEKDIARVEQLIKLRDITHQLIRG